MRKLGFSASILCALALLATPRTGHAACASGGTVQNVNDCIPGGKSSRDCFVELSVFPVPPPDPNSGYPSRTVTCLDNDPSCDADTTPGQCTFLVASCVNVADPVRLPLCTATDAATYEITAPTAKQTTKPHVYGPFTRANRHAQDLGLDAIIPTSTPNVCAPENRFVVSLKNNGTKKGKGKFGVKIFDSAGDKDSDKVKFTCLPNPAIATIPCASARQITSASELIGGPLAVGRVGDWLIENDKARFIVRDVGRDFSFMLTYGGHIIDADFQRKLGPSTLSPPYPPGQDSMEALTPLINISSTDNPTSISVINSGASGGPAILRTTGPDDLFDPIDPRVAILGFSTSLSVPTAGVDNNIPVTITNDYTLNCGDNFVEMETTINNSGGSPLDLYIGDYLNVNGQVETVAPTLGFGDSALRVGAASGNETYNYIGWVGFGDVAGLSYAVIPQLYQSMSSFAQSGVTVPVYGQNLVGVLLGSNPNDPGKDPGILPVPASGTNSFKRWFGVSDNAMGKVLDERHHLSDPVIGEITPPVDTFYLQGTVTVAGVPVDGARVTVLSAFTGGLITTFETRDGGFYQGTLDKSGHYVVGAKLLGYPYEGGGSSPIMKPVSIAATSVVDFDLPGTGFVKVTAADGVTTGPLAAKVSVVGLQASPEPVISQNLTLATVTGSVFGYDAREKVVIYGLPQVHFAGVSGDTGVFAIQPGTYQFVVSHGPEYSVSKTTLTVTAGSPGSPQVINASLVPVVDTTGFVSSDYHVHLINSPDSVITKNERITTMLAEGVDYFVASDHDFITDLTNDVAALGASALVKTAPSQEITYFDSGHFGAYPLSIVNPNSVTGGAIDWGREGEPVGLGYPSDGSYDLSPNEMVLLAKGPPYNAKVVQANHFNSGTLGYFRVHGIDTTAVPPQSSTAPNKLRLDPSITNTYTDELTALELWIENTRGQNALAIGENLGDWFNLLNNFNSTNPTYRKTATFDSDTHSTTVVQAGGPRNMVASSTDSPGLIDPSTLADNLNDGRNIGTNGPYMTVSISGSAAPPASHGLASPMLVKATGGSATVTVNVQSPDWAQYDRVQIFVNNVPSCTTTSPNFVGGSKKLCLPTPNFNVAVSPTAVVLPNGGTRLTATVVQPLTITQDSWVVVIVKGTDGVSRPLFPMAPQSILPKACAIDPCKPCTNDGQCGFGTCSVTNQTLTELTDGNLGQCGVTALAIANPLFIDFDGDGLYKGVAIP
jgi:hypothetical protein